MKTNKSIIPTAGKKYYSLSNIKKCKARYNIIFGKRSNGKTYSVLNEIIKNHSKNGTCGVYIRRFADDITSYNISALFRQCVNNGLLKKYYGDKYDNIIYYGKIFYLCKDNKKLDILCYAVALNTAEKTKGADRAECEIFCLDEFITRRYYLVNEMQKLKDIISTFARDRLDNVVIYMLSNSVTKISYYFDELKITNIVKNIKMGCITSFTNEYGAKIAIEYTDSDETTEAANEIFNVTDDPTGKMILTGEWGENEYPHPPDDYIDKNIVFVMYFESNGEFVRANFYNDYIVVSLTNLKHIEKYAKYLYSQKTYNINGYVFNDLSIIPNVKNIINRFLALNKIYFTTNTAGEIFYFSLGKQK